MNKANISAQVLKVGLTLNRDVRKKDILPQTFKSAGLVKVIHTYFYSKLE